MLEIRKQQGSRMICNSRCDIKCILFNELCIALTVELIHQLRAPSFQHSNCLAPTNRYIKQNLATNMNVDIIAICISA